MVGKYEKLRLHDQSEIQKLKDRIHEFNTYNTREIDNTTTSNTDNRDVVLDNETNLNSDADVNELFKKLKDILRSRA